MRWQWRCHCSSIFQVVIVNKLRWILNPFSLPLYINLDTIFTIILRPLPCFFVWCTALDHDCHNSLTSIIRIPETDSVPKWWLEVRTPLGYTKREFSIFLSQAIWPLNLWNFQQVLYSIIFNILFLYEYCHHCIAEKRACSQQIPPGSDKHEIL